ncbi:MAG: glycosyltransferase family 2 protein [bacterium]|nr:glycosyltransferase family 2 protein [bacterium]
MTTTRSAPEPKVVSVVLNWNGWLDTVECLESLLRAEYGNHQIVVCDNRSQDHSIERLTEWADGLLEVASARDAASGWSYKPVRKPVPYVLYASPAEAFAADPTDAPLVFIRNGSNLGYAAGNNVGMRFAIERLACAYVWVLNNDTIVERTAIAALSDQLALASGTAVLGSRIMQYEAPGTIQALGGGTLDPRTGRETQIGRGRSEHEQIDTAMELEHVIGASMFVRAEAFADVGPIDESYFLYREETDWCIELRKRGWRLEYCPQSVVWHKESRSFGFKSVLHDYYAVRNMLFLIQKHFPQSLPTAFLVTLARAVAPKIARLQFRRLRYVFKAYRDFLRGVRGKTEVNPDLFFMLERGV